MEGINPHPVYEGRGDNPIRSRTATLPLGLRYLLGYMRLRRKTIVGKITPTGELNAPWQVLMDFCSMHKDRGIILRAEILSKEPSEKTCAYFWGYVIDEIRNALMQEYGERFTKEQTYDWIRKQCSLFYAEERIEGKWKVRIKEFEELSQEEANEAIDDIIQFCAENLSLIIDAPK